MTVTEKDAAARRLMLSRQDQQRLERLAALAGRSPQAMLKFVLRDGFTECEETVRENLAAERELGQGQGQGVAHAQVMQSVKALLSVRASHARKAG